MLLIGFLYTVVIYIYQYQDSILDPCFGAIVQFNLLLAVCIKHNECFLSTLAKGYQPFTLLLQRFFSQWIKIIRGEHGHQVFMCCTITYGVSNDGYDTASDLIQQVPKRGVDFGCASPTFQLRSGFQSEFISTVFNIWFLYILYERVIQKPKNKKSSLNVCVEAAGGEAAGGEGTRDTESKTRTPHKDVGKNKNPTQRCGGKPRSGECFAWMDGHCSDPNCRFKHVCASCGSSQHDSRSCPQSKE